MRPLALALAALALTACSQDFGLEGIAPPNRAEDGDTGEVALDEDPPEETAGEEEPADEEPGETVDEEEEEPVEEEAPPDEEEPVEEEEAPEDDCTETDDRVYVIERDADTVYLFDPESLSFEALGRLSCGAGGATPGSMAVGRDGVAWIRMSDDSLYQLSLDSLECRRTAFRLPTGFDSFGMGFATEEAGTWRDRLFVADTDTLGLLDTDDLSLDPLGGMPSQAELTGNSAGELWAFLPLESPATLVRLDQEDGAELDRIGLSAFPRASDIDTFAFATWGGDFWLFVRTYGMGNSTDVYRVTPEGTMTRVLHDVGFDVVGAGVSTCAPSE